MLYAVFQEGVYRHDCGGIYDTLEGATVAADAIACADRDDYHTYEVVPFALNEAPADEKYVYETKRSTAIAKRDSRLMCSSAAWVAK